MESSSLFRNVFLVSIVFQITGCKPQLVTSSLAVSGEGPEMRTLNQLCARGKNEKSNSAGRILSVELPNGIRLVKVTSNVCNRNGTRGEKGIGTGGSLFLAGPNGNRSPKKSSVVFVDFTVDDSTRNDSNPRNRQPTFSGYDQTIQTLKASGQDFIDLSGKSVAEKKKLTENAANEFDSGILVLGAPHGRLQTTADGKSVQHVLMGGPLKDQNPDGLPTPQRTIDKIDLVASSFGVQDRKLVCFVSSCLSGQAAEDFNSKSTLTSEQKQNVAVLGTTQKDKGEPATDGESQQPVVLQEWLKGFNPDLGTYDQMNTDGQPGISVGEFQNFFRTKNPIGKFSAQRVLKTAVTAEEKKAFFELTPAELDEKLKPLTDRFDYYADDIQPTVVGPDQMLLIPPPAENIDPKGFPVPEDVLTFEEAKKETEVAVTEDEQDKIFPNLGEAKIGQAPKDVEHPLPPPESFPDQEDGLP